MKLTMLACYLSLTLCLTPPDFLPEGDNTSQFVSMVSNVIEADRKAGKVASRDFQFDKTIFGGKKAVATPSKQVSRDEMDYLTDWIDRVLLENLMPHPQQDVIEWSLIELPEAPMADGKVEQASHVTAKYFPPAKNVRRVEVHRITNKDSMTFLIEAPEWLGKAELNQSQVKNLLRQIVKFPDGKLPDISVLSESHVLNGHSFTYGHVFDKMVKSDRYENPPKLKTLPPGVPPGDYYEYIPLIPDDKREWYSPMTFWITDGKMCLTISTIDWKSGDRPM